MPSTVLASKARLSAWVVFIACSSTATVGASALTTTVAGCSSSDDTANNGNATDAGASSGFQSSGDLPDAPPPPTCVSKEAEAVPGARPVDIIFAIDNSVSMSEEIGEVEKQINQNFASIIEASKTDYRVIMLSNHGTHDNNESIKKICVAQPLSGTSCTPIPAKPAENAKFVHHNVVINSQDTLCQILQTYNGPDKDGSHPQGWAAFLRPNAFKVFTVITDDRVATNQCGGFKFDDKFDDLISAKNAAAAFESALYGLTPPQFGNAVRRNFIWHSIVALAPFDTNNTAKPYPPTAPMTTQQCTPGAVASGLGYQALSQLTGGLRFPTCGLDYTTIFKEIALGVIDNALLPCDYALPANPAGGTIDPATAIVRYTSGTNVSDFEQVANEAACGAKKFFIEDGRIRLCTDSCLAIQTDPVAQVKILFGCLPKQTK